MIHHVIMDNPVVVLWHKDMRMKTKEWDTMLCKQWNPKRLSFPTLAPLTVVTHAFLSKCNHVAYASLVHEWVKDVAKIGEDRPAIDIVVSGYSEEKDELFDSQIMTEIRNTNKNF